MNGNEVDGIREPIFDWCMLIEQVKHRADPGLNGDAFMSGLIGMGQKRVEGKTRIVEELQALTQAKPIAHFPDKLDDARRLIAPKPFFQRFERYQRVE